MSIKAALHHRTSYQYDRRVALGPQVIRLRPAPHSRTPVPSYSLKISPGGHFINWQQDPFGNYLARVVFPDPVDHFEVDVDLVADLAVYNPFDFFLEPTAETWPFDYGHEAKRDLAPYLIGEEMGPRLKAWVDSVPRDEMGTVDFLVALNGRLEKEIDYLIRMEPGVQSCEETLELARGSCRDTAWLLIQILRHLGLAARFVSGYLIQLKPDVKSLDGPSGTDVDFTDLHAWAEVYLPGAGWVGLDPTSGLFAGEGHIPLACSPQPQSAAPISGAVEPSKVTFDFDMSVTRIEETPRVTRPYTEAQWAEIDRLGHEVDAKLAAGDVRLTMGGEPTFVSIDDPDGDEWNSAATGPTKEKLAGQLIRRLRDRFAPGALIQYGQGKWYPGEQLPRWAYAVYWREDGEPVWSRPDLLADRDTPKKATADDAKAFAQGIATRLGLEPECAQEVYEDPWEFIELERKLPENLDPSTAKFDDPMLRERIARVFERGLDTPVGTVLPVQRWNAKSRDRRWKSKPWTTRAGRLFLVPGDSAVGFRLPMPSLKHIPPTDYPYVVPADPFEARGPLPRGKKAPASGTDVPGSGDSPADQSGREQLTLKRSEGGEAAQAVMEQSLGEDGDEVRTAIAVEPRDGVLNVFMPPVEEVEDYLELISVVEETAADMNMPVVVEGYSPPHDPRLNVIKVTPDPGVIEVNVQPATNWQMLKDIVFGIYEDAHFTRLGTEKFMLDGRHTGTGGGNHVVVGGLTPADSPFLRRPDLLKSLVTYWQRHPSLSYLFSGLFIGPTSQAARIDEARHDQIMELELAFKQIPKRGQGDVPPWLVDRILRNILIDVTGNTHRTEICIDKLYSPDGPTGRLGLVEFRAFEMPPHPQMSLAQQLLLRAMIARFWDQPYDAPLIRWGTALHDRFMLPHFVWSDFLDVIDDMNRAGFALDPAWFAPHWEFRFPSYGVSKYGDVTIELRQALEPWYVLGETGAIGGTSRSVDSSVERLQVEVTGMDAGRYELGCNGFRAPLHATGESGSFVAGIRFRAWSPGQRLHPTIGVHSPLVFDLYDTANGRAVAGCTYHVAHPGGRNYETFPVNSYEAEARRLVRFFATGHSHGASELRESGVRPEFPMTLDMRWTD